MVHTEELVISIVTIHNLSVPLSFIKIVNFMYIPPDLVPWRDLMTPRISGMQIFIMLIHVWYTQSSCLSLSLQFIIYLGLFFLKTGEFYVFTPRFGPKEGLNKPWDPGDGYFCNANTCIVHAEQFLISIFTIHNLSGPLSPKNP